MRATLADWIGRFLHFIAYETFPTHNEHRNSFPQEWELEQPERFKEFVTHIQGSAGQCVDAYKALIREARSRLAVTVPVQEDGSNDTPA